MKYIQANPGFYVIGVMRETPKHATSDEVVSTEPIIAWSIDKSGDIYPVTVSQEYEAPQEPSILTPDGAVIQPGLCAYKNIEQFVAAHID